MLRILNDKKGKLPIVVMPYSGESLLGYLLRLGKENSFKSGTLLNEFVYNFKYVSKYMISFQIY